MANGSPTDIAAAIARHLTSRGVPPTQAWMQSFMPSIRPNTPLVALQKTALFRLLATDLTTSVQTSASSTLPANLSDPEVRERTLPGPVTVQVLDIEDIGRSRWSQVQALDAHERGETTRGREIIRVVADESDPNASAAHHESASSGPHKLLLQDANGLTIYAVELASIHGVGVQTCIGAKLVLSDDVVVARGLLLLEPRNVEVLGGKVEAWDQAWRAGRKEVLERKAGMTSHGG